MMPALLLVGTLVVVALFVLLAFRLGSRLGGVSAEIDRLRVVQRDMSSDVRARLDEGARSWASVERDLRPRLDQLEPSVADLGAVLDEHLPALSDARSRLESVEQRVAAACARLDAALDTALEGEPEGERDQRFERIEEAVRTLRHATDERLADLGDRLRALEDGPVSTAGAVGAGVAGAAPRGTGSAVGSSRARRAKGRWMLVMLVAALGIALALLA